MVGVVNSAFVKKTFNIKSEYNKMLKYLVPTRKQTDFINKALESALTHEMNKAQRAEGLSILQKFNNQKKNLSKNSPKITEVLQNLRDEMTNE
jgi:hypothetical protein